MLAHLCVCVLNSGCLSVFNCRCVCLLVCARVCNIIWAGCCVQWCAGVFVCDDVCLLWCSLRTVCPVQRVVWCLLCSTRLLNCVGLVRVERNECVCVCGVLLDFVWCVIIDV